MAVSTERSVSDIVNEVVRQSLREDQEDLSAWLLSKSLTGGRPIGDGDANSMDDQGRLARFFLHGRPGGDPAGCPAGQSPCEQRFGSATEVEGSDGSLFRLDSGDRATVTVSNSDDGKYRSASDPDIFFDGKQYVLYLSHGPSTSVWTSPELRGQYTSVSSLPKALLTKNSCGVGSGFFEAASGQYWLYCHRPAGDKATMIYSARFTDFSRQLGQNDLKTTISGESLGLGAGVNVESPGFAVNQP